MASYCIWWMWQQLWKFYPSKMTQSTMVIQQIYLLSCFVKTSSKFTSAGCSYVLRIFSLVTLLTWNATIIILFCQEVGRNETFIAPQRAYYLSGRKGKCYPSPNLSFCSQFPVPPPSCISPQPSSYLIHLLCLQPMESLFLFTSASHILWLSCSSNHSFLPPSCIAAWHWPSLNLRPHSYIFVSQGM